MKCEYCGKEYDSSLLSWLCEALDEWEYASQYKGEYLAFKHRDKERIAELRQELEKATITVETEE